jgi:hypothetical protein
MVLGRVFELFALVNGAENLALFRFSKTVFGCVLLSGSQILFFLILPSSWLTRPMFAVVRASPRMSPIKHKSGAIQNTGHGAGGPRFPISWRLVDEFIDQPQNCSAVWPQRNRILWWTR